MSQPRPIIERSVPLIDLEIERGGDGRTVTAYAATFDMPYEVMDFDGHYDEIINRAAFNRFLTGGFGRVRVMYNHARIPGSNVPSDRWSTPVAVPVEIKAEPRGLLTRSKYLTTPEGEHALTQWKEGAVTAQSFRGPVWRSAPFRSGANGRPVRERLDLGLTEYGPAVFAINEMAGLVAIRSLAEMTSEERLAAISELSDEERAELARLLTLDTPIIVAPPDETADDKAGDEDDAPADPGPSLELLEAEQRQRRRHNSAA